MAALIPVILCGGLGARLWPVSRRLQPKPFMKLSDGKSLLHHTYHRALQLPQPAEIMFATHRDLFFRARDEICTEDPHPPCSFLLEQQSKNTAPAVASVTLDVIARYGADALILIMPADHIILNITAFQNAVARASELAALGKIVAFGIKPDTPETGFGYIEADGETVLRFHEKPSLETAKYYLEQGHFLWNSGMFCFSAGTMLEALEQFEPRILSQAKQSLNGGTLLTNQHMRTRTLDADAFQHITPLSIDKAVMEKSDKLAVVATDMGWSDVGCWQRMGQTHIQDSSGNVAEGEVMLQEVANCYIRSPHRLISVIGVQDLIVIDTEDALLITSKQRAEDVQIMYAKLQSLDHETC